MWNPSGPTKIYRESTQRRRVNYRYHLIVPSLPGWLYSSPPPLDKEFGPKDIAYLVNGLMVGLGFDKYIAHGGDIGSFICDELAQKYDACTGESRLPSTRLC